MWYVIWTTTGREEYMKDMVVQLIDHSLYERLEILYKVRNIKIKKKWEKKKEKLIPSYLFVETDRINDFAMALKKVPKFSLVLQMDGNFQPLEEKDLKLIDSFASHADGIEVSKGFIVGDKINVTEGPLLGMEGFIKKIDRHKRIAIISLKLFERETDVSVGLEIVEKRPEEGADDEEKEP